jgi:hypothetical protein
MSTSVVYCIQQLETNVSCYDRYACSIDMPIQSDESEMFIKRLSLSSLF